MRLDKLIEEQLQTSRKEMKRLFLRKKVSVDGKITLNDSQNVDSELHQIEVDGQRLLTNEVYYLLAKPKGVVTAKRDREHQTVFDLLKSEAKVDQLVPVGRLDRDTEGLLLMTSNGQLVYDLLHPTKKVVKVYQAVINEHVTQEDVEAFAEGIVFLDGPKCQPAQLTILAYDEKTNESFVELAISEGKFHQVKKMFLACGKKVIALKRVAMAPLRLENLEMGSYRKLTAEELQQLKAYFR